MIIVNSFQPLNIITNCSILDVAAVLDLFLATASNHAMFQIYQLWFLNKSQLAKKVSHFAQGCPESKHCTKNEVFN